MTHGTALFVADWIDAIFIHFAVNAARAIARAVADYFGDELRIGIGINTGRLIVGSIGGGGRLEFALIGDVVNVAARVEQLTKETGDVIFITETTRGALRTQPALAPRGNTSIRGKAAQ